MSPTLPATSSPAVSVVVAAYNSASYIRDAIGSLSRQTMPDFEIIVVDDASTDETPEILAALARAEPRLRVVRLASNHGAFGAANVGLAAARAPLIARFDSDDISLPERLAVQKAYMDAHPDCILLSSGFHRIDWAGRLIGSVRRQRDGFRTAWLGRFHYPLNHSAAMFRRLGPDGRPLRYDVRARSSLDYDFYAQVRDLGTVVSLPERLLCYRAHGGSISATRRAEQLHMAREISQMIQAQDLPSPVRDALEPFNHAFLSCEPVPPALLFDGMRAVISHDAAHNPSERPWMMRQSCALILMAMDRMGMGKKAALRAFGVSAPDFLPSLGLKVLETMRTAVPARLGHAATF